MASPRGVETTEPRGGGGQRTGVEESVGRPHGVRDRAVHEQVPERHKHQHRSEPHAVRKRPAADDKTGSGHAPRCRRAVCAPRGGTPAGCSRGGPPRGGEGTRGGAGQTRKSAPA